MPEYEYICKACGAHQVYYHTEFLKYELSCIKCGKRELEKWQDSPKETHK
jgi:hypothetical protein